jgi:hypothetical protein
VETTLAYWCGSGQMLTPGLALLWLLVAASLAVNLTNP